MYGYMYKLVCVPCVASIRDQTSSISVVTNFTFLGSSEQQAMHGAGIRAQATYMHNSSGCQPPSTTTSIRLLP
jgi:hypothetical protein